MGGCVSLTRRWRVLLRAAWVSASPLASTRREGWGWAQSWGAALGAGGCRSGQGLRRREGRGHRAGRTLGSDRGLVRDTALAPTAPGPVPLPAACGWRRGPRWRRRPRGALAAAAAEGRPCGGRGRRSGGAASSPHTPPAPPPGLRHWGPYCFCCVAGGVGGAPEEARKGQGRRRLPRPCGLSTRGCRAGWGVVCIEAWGVLSPQNELGVRCAADRRRGQAPRDSPSPALS